MGKKGSTWKKHKYIRKENGKYIYSDKGPVKIPWIFSQPDYVKRGKGPHTYITGMSGSGKSTAAKKFTDHVVEDLDKRRYHTGSGTRKDLLAGDAKVKRLLARINKKKKPHVVEGIQLPFVSKAIGDNTLRIKRTSVLRSMANLFKRGRQVDMDKYRYGIKDRPPSILTDIRRAWETVKFTKNKNLEFKRGVEKMIRPKEAMTPVERAKLKESKRTLTPERLKKQWNRVAKVIGVSPNSAEPVVKNKHGMLGLVDYPKGKKPQMIISPEARKHHLSSILAHEGTHAGDVQAKRLGKLGKRRRELDREVNRARGNKAISDDEYNALVKKRNKAEKLTFRTSNRAEAKATMAELNKKVPLNKGRNTDIMDRHRSSSNENVWNPQWSSHNSATDDNYKEFKRRKKKFEDDGGFSAEGIKNKAWLRLSMTPVERASLKEVSPKWVMSKLGGKKVDATSGVVRLMPKDIQDKIKKVHGKWMPTVDRGPADAKRRLAIVNRYRKHSAGRSAGYHMHGASKTTRTNPLTGRTSRRFIRRKEGNLGKEKARQELSGFRKELQKDVKQGRRSITAQAKATPMTDKEMGKHAKRAGVTVGDVRLGVGSSYSHGNRHIRMDPTQKTVATFAHEGGFKGGGHGSQRSGKSRASRINQPDADPSTRNTSSSEMDASMSAISAAKRAGKKMTPEDARVLNIGLASYTNPNENEKARKFFKRGGFRRKVK